MTTPAEGLERELVVDLEGLQERFSDEEFSSELYRALANTVWRKEGRAGEISLSWNRAEQVVNDLRARRGESALELAQTGGEGEVSPVVAEELTRLGWNAAPLDTSRHHRAHLAQPESAPPADQGERQAPVSDSDDWERTAHEEADAERLRRLGGVSPPADQGT